MNNQPNPEERQRIVDDVLKHLHHSIGEPSLTPVDQLLARTKKLISDVNTSWQFRLKVNPDLIFNRSAATEQISQMFLEKFRTWDKEELLFVCVMLHTELVLERM